MKFEPRYYQADAFKAFTEYTAENWCKNPLIVLPTGTGKAYLQAMIVQWMLEWDHTKILLLTHDQTLIEQNYDELMELMNDRLVDAGIYCAGLKRREARNRITFASIQSVHKRAWSDIGFRDIIIIDEAHRVPHKDEGTYRAFIAEMRKINPKIIIVGLTATQYRMKGGLLTEGKTKIFDDICYEVTIPELINPEHPKNRDKKQYLCNITTPKKAMKSKVDLSGVHIRYGEYIEKEMQEAFCKDNLVERSVKEIIEHTQDRKHVLVFTAGIDHCTEVIEAFEKFGQSVDCGHSKRTDIENQKALYDFKSGKIKYLVNVDKWTTGFNYKPVDCIAILRAMKSVGLYVQICVDSETEILTTRGFLKYNEIKKDDIVYAFDLKNQNIKKTEIENIIINKRKKNDSMYSYKSLYLDFRVTEQHDMIFKSRKTNIWKKENIEKMILNKDSFHVPVSSIEYNENKCILKDCEIEFLGWFLSDGTINKKTNAIQISQSLTNLHYIKEIEECLIKTGMKYGKKEIKRKGDLSKYNNNIVFSISKGEPRGRDKDKKGWSYLEEYIDKNINSNYDKMNKRQIKILLSSINKGDGSKRKTITWEEKTMTLAMGNNKLYADNLQSLLIRKGFRCNLSARQNKSSEWVINPKIQYFLLVKEIENSSIAGINCKDGKIKNKKSYKRTRIQKEEIINEEIVWCIKNKYGTIITRRNGKVLIMGNCGRGTRIDESKNDCLILDFGGNIETHGPIDKIEIKKQKDGTTKAEGMPEKCCPKCESMLALAVMVCPDCGYEFPQKDKHEDKASEADILSKWKKPEIYDVEYIDYSIHQKIGKPDSLRVKYYIGDLMHYDEYVCPLHDGFAKKKALRWLELRLPIEKLDKPLYTIQDIIDHSDRIRKVKQIIVDINGKFPQITGHIFEDIQTEIEVKEHATAI